MTKIYIIFLKYNVCVFYTNINNFIRIHLTDNIDNQDNIISQYYPDSINKMMQDKSFFL